MSLTLTIDQGHSHPHLGVFLMGELKEVHPLYEFVENRKELKDTITNLASIILKKEESQSSNEETIENRESNIKISTSS